MAVPKKKKSKSATKRQHHAYVLTQVKKLLGMVDREKRHEKGREVMMEEKAAKKQENVTTIQA